MKLTRSRLIFDAAIESQYGEQVVVSCSSFKQMESMRVLLQRERQSWRERTAGTDQPDVAISSNKDRLLLILEKIPPVAPPVIIAKDGSVKGTIDLSPQDPRESVTEKSSVTVGFISDIERQKALMRADGISEEEIEDYFREKGPDLSLKEKADG